jgi:hypothetical protein
MGVDAPDLIGSMAAHLACFSQTRLYATARSKPLNGTQKNTR